MRNDTNEKYVNLKSTAKNNIKLLKDEAKNVLNIKSIAQIDKMKADF